MLWLLQERVARELEQARRIFNARTPLEQLAIHKAHIEAREAARPEAASGAPRILNIAGSEAEITVEGCLSMQPDWWLDYQYGGNTAYVDIMAALALADADPNVKRIILAINSPGGQADGLFECVQAIEATQKPVIARARCALSAAYAIAAATDKIEAISDASEFGCLGVAVTYYFYLQEQDITIVNTESPDKRPDPRTPEGKDAIQADLDRVYAWFADGIARGREVSLDDVNTNFGKGAVFGAAEAKRRKMIDGMAAQRTRQSRSAARAESNPEPGAPEMATAAPVTGKESDTMNKKLIAQLLGLSADASDEALEAGIVALDAAKKAAEGKIEKAEANAKTAQAAVARFETALGAQGDAAFGALDGVLASNKQLKEENAKHEAAQAERDKAAEATKREALVAQGKADGKLTAKLIEYYSTKPIGELEGYLAHASRIVPEALEQPRTSSEQPPKGAAAELTHNGKTWAQMTGNEKATLKRENPSHYNAMRNAALKIAS